jgi:exopolysaccharide biosynthesis polyprenyl glycosylphosphotransferase
MATADGQRGAVTAEYRPVRAAWPGGVEPCPGGKPEGSAPSGGVRGVSDPQDQHTGLGRGRYSAQRLSRVVPVAALPLADLLGLGLTARVTGRAGLPMAAFALTVLAILAFGGQHRLRICLRVSDQVARILSAVALSLPVLLLWLPAGQAGWLAVWTAGLVFTSRALLYAALRAAHRRGLLTEPTLVVGAGTLAAHMADLMCEHPEFGLRPMGFIDDGPPRRDLSLPSLGHLADLRQVVARQGIRRVIICWAVCHDEDLIAVLRASRPLGADVCVVPRLYELGVAVPRACLDEIWGIPLIPLRGFSHRSAGLWLKRIFDVVMVSILLAATSPVLLALALVIRLQSRRAPLFRQDRVTGDGQITTILKLRTLDEHSDPDTRWSVPMRQSSPLSRWLRTTHLDELPQLVNVLRGDMSLVGPRPERPYFAERFNREIPHYVDRNRMQAGITGWAQVHGLHGDTSIYERARFDNQYIEYWSPWLDVVILARTLAAAIRAAAGGAR